MALSDDLRSIQVVLGDIAHGNPDIVNLLCDNLMSIAEQVEALESLPLTGSAELPVSMLDPARLATRSSGTFVQ